MIKYQLRALAAVDNKLVLEPISPWF